MINFPQRGIHDNKPTPKQLYDIIVNELHFIDVCLDKNKFNAKLQLWPNKSYCNPPFSEKAQFVSRAASSHRAGREVLLYLPFDPTTGWFETLYHENPLIIIFMKRMQHNRWPVALFHLKNYDAPRMILVKSEVEIKKLLNGPQAVL